MGAGGVPLSWAKSFEKLPASRGGPVRPGGVKEGKDVRGGGGAHDSEPSPRPVLPSLNTSHHVHIITDVPLLKDFSH